jgi:AAA15 family ATPase/GTPase
VLLEFGFKNYFSFREGMTMSFRLDAKCPVEISAGKEITPVICVKGANASGKTQVLKSLAFLGRFCADSFQSDPEGPIPLNPFFDSPDPSEFFVEFSVDETSYRYELVATDRRVVRETLYRTKSRKVKVLERLANEVTSSTKSMHQLAAITLRDNASIISTVRQYKLVVPEMDSVYKFFKLIFPNVSYGGLKEDQADINAVSKYLHGHPEVFKFVKQFIAECDAGISDIRIIETDDPNSGKRYFPVFYHEYNGVSHPVIAMIESSGTKTLFRNLSTYYTALSFGGIVVADEMDINLHPYLLAKLIDLFLEDSSNPRGAQLVFSTHNTEILDQLGRYRTYLVNKRDNQSFAYRLDEIPGDILRNDRPISPAYKEGKIGGVPIV